MNLIVKRFFSKSVLLLLIATCSFIMPVYVIVTIRRGLAGAYITPIFGEDADLLTLILLCLMVLSGLSRIHATYIYNKNLDCIMLIRNMMETLYLYIMFSILIYILLLYPVYATKYTKFFNILIILFYIIYISSLICNIHAFFRIKTIKMMGVR